MLNRIVEISLRLYAVRFILIAVASSLHPKMIGSELDHPACWLGRIYAYLSL